MEKTFIEYLELVCKNHQITVTKEENYGTYCVKTSIKFVDVRNTSKTNKAH
jgi:hypothetical protein